MLPDGTWYHSSDMDTKEIIRRIKTELDGMT